MKLSVFVASLLVLAGCLDWSIRKAMEDGEADGDVDTDVDADCDSVGDVPGDWLLPRPGTFTMGSPSGEVGRYDDEEQHEVTLTHYFLIQFTEVTQRQFQDVMGYNPSSFSECPDCPVETVSWHEAAAYCNALSCRADLEPCYSCEGSRESVVCAPVGSPYDCLGYRLPTEAEWEYAARAGDTRATYTGDLDWSHSECESPNPVLDEIAWFCGNSDDHTHEVGTLDPNGWGLHDMLGNVWEWCHDWYADYPRDSVTDPYGPGAGTDRVLRGGAWNFNAMDIRAAGRNRYSPDYHYNDVGFRPTLNGFEAGRK
jgi:formylglycine-generating enzyme required for sulfatase activity